MRRDLNQRSPCTLTQALFVAWPPHVTRRALGTVLVQDSPVQSWCSDACDWLWFWLWLWLGFRLGRCWRGHWFGSWRRLLHIARVFDTLWAWAVRLDRAIRIIRGVVAPSIHGAVLVPHACTLTFSCGACRSGGSRTRDGGSRRG